MRKFTALILCLALSLMCIPAQAMQINTIISSENEESVILIGDQYYADIQINGDIVTSSLKNKAETVVQKSVYNKVSGEITTYIYPELNLRTTLSPIEVRHNNIQDFWANTSTESADTSVMPTSIPSYRFLKSYTTDYYKTDGTRLKGDAYYRELGIIRDYNGCTYGFAKGVAMTAVLATIAGLCTGKWGAELAANVAESLCLGELGAYLTHSLNLYTARRDINWQFMCEMEYNNRDYRTAEINKNLEYIYVSSDYTNKETYQLDMFSYASEKDAIEGFCSEVVGYGAQAYSYKFISAVRPDLQLPVNGPASSWT